MKQRIIIFFIQLGLYITLQAQPSTLAFDHYNTDNGLSNNEVNDITQDEDGFIWIATRGGLNRFDGKDFVKYYSDRSQNHLPSNDIFRILRLPFHRLLVGTGKGIGILDTHTGFTQQLIIPSANDLKINTNRITDLLVDSNKNIIATTYTGIYLFDSSLHLVFRYDAFSPADIGRKRIVFAYVLDMMGNGKVLIQGSSKLLLLDVKNKKLESVDTSHQAILDKWNYSPYLLLKLNDKNQAFLVDSNKQNTLTLNLIDFNYNKIFALSFPFSIAREIFWKSKLFFLNDSLLSINSSFRNGLYLFKVDSKKTSLEFKGNILSGIQCNWSFVDKDKRLWVGTDEGLYKQSFRKTAFHNFITPTTGKKRDIDNYVNGFARAPNQLFVSSYSQGLLVYDQNDSFLRRIDLEKFHKYNLPWNINAYRKDSFLIPTQIGLALLSSRNGNLQKFWRPGMPVVVDSVAITATFIDSHHQLWIGLGSGYGAFMMNINNRTWQLFSPAAGQNAFPLRYPLCISEDLQGNIWMSGREGITRWNWNKKIFDTLIKKIAGFRDDLSGQWTYSTTDKAGNLWVCPEDFVLIKWNLQTNQINVFQRPSNFAPLRSAQVYGPWNNQLWVQTNVGLLAFNVLTEKFTLLRKADGLPDENLVDGRIYYDSISNRIYAGFNNAFTWFYPDEVLDKKSSAEVYITDIRKIGDTLSYAGRTDLKFSHNNNSISISYTGVNFDDGELNTYAYRLFEKKTSAWINAGDEKTLSFANLKPGDYTFQVKTILSDGTESRQPANITLIISPAFYQTSWFYLLCIITVVAGAYSLYRYRINQLLRVQKVRNDISSDLHDDIGAKLTNINILAMLSEQNLQQPEIIGTYMRRIAAEIQSSGQALDDIVWSINSNNDSVTEIIARMRRYAADIFEATTISFQFNSDKKISNRNMVMEQRRDLFLVYKEAITNIQKHAMATEVKINVRAEKKQISLTISDNGKGFDVSQSTYRNGLKNMRNRIEKWKGDFAVSSSRLHGTTISILLP